MLHELKCENPYFQDAWEGRKDFEARINDRKFQVGDLIKLIEVNTPRPRFLIRKIKYILEGERFGIRNGYVILGLEDFNKHHYEIH